MQRIGTMPETRAIRTADTEWLRMDLWQADALKRIVDTWLHSQAAMSEHVVADVIAARDILNALSQPDNTHR